MLQHPADEGPTLVIGSAGMDLIGRANTELSPRTSNPGRLRISHGEVARNVAENLALLGIEPILISSVGEDPEGMRLLQHAVKTGGNIDYVLTVPDRTTGAYLAILDATGRLQFALDDINVVESISPEHIRSCKGLFEKASLVFLDANLDPKSIKTIIQLANRFQVPVAADPTSASLAPRLFPHLQDLWLITPNESEAATLCPHPVPHANIDRALSAARHLVSHGGHIAVIAMAEFGVGYATAHQSGHVPAVRTEIVDPTGAGDAMSAAILFALHQRSPLDEAVRLGVSAASHTLRYPGSVSPSLSLEMLYEEL